MNAASTDPTGAGTIVLIHGLWMTGRPHFPGVPGWEEVADYALEWASANVGRTSSTTSNEKVPVGQDHR